MIKIKSKLMRRGLIVIVLPLVLQMVFICALAYFLIQTENEVDQRVESKKIVSLSTQIVAKITDAEFLSMMYNAQHLPMLDVRFDEDTRDAQGLLHSLKKLAVTEDRTKLVKAIESSVEETLDRLKRVFTDEIESDIRFKNFTSIPGKTEHAYDRFTVPFGKVDKLLEYEQKTQAKVQSREKLYRRYMTNALWWWLVLNVVQSILLGVYFIKSITGRLRVVLQNTTRLLNREPLAAPIGGDDELSQLDQVFHATAKDLAYVDRHRKHLVSLVRDELKEPLSSVRHTLNNLSQGVLGDLTPKAKSRIDLAVKDTDRLVRLIDDLLSIETMQGSKFDLALKPMSTTDLVNDALGSVKDMADRHGVKLEVRDPELMLIADRDRLIQVMINFLSNAIKFSPKDGTITVSVIDQDRMLEFQVIDRGRGVPPDKMQKIFEPFQQVESSDQTAKGGTGLGLPISKTIVEQHGGAIGVKSEPGMGSTFWFRVPKRPSES